MVGFIILHHMNEEYSSELKLIIERCKNGKNPTLESLKALRAPERAIAMEYMEEMGKRTMAEIHNIVNKGQEKH